MKRIIGIVLAICLSLSLAGCCLSHEWDDATCTKPKTCSKCGETKGEALGHKWKSATCEQAKQCSVCGQEEGDPLGHEILLGSYFVDKENLTYNQVCSRCRQNINSSTIEDLIGDISISSFLHRYNIGAAKVCSEFKLDASDSDAPTFIQSETTSGYFHGIIDLGESCCLVFDGKNSSIPEDGSVGRAAFRRTNLTDEDGDNAAKFRLYAFLYALNPDATKDELKSVWDYYMFQRSSDTPRGRTDFAGSGSITEVKVASDAPSVKNIKLQARVWSNGVGNLYFITGGAS